jgi:hypothetical protein
MKHCWHIRSYTARLKKWKNYPDGGGTNFEATHLLGRALYLNSKLPLKQRQIDVRIRGKRNGAYVLEGSYSK